MRFEQTFAQSVAIDADATYRYDAAIPKPCVHPLVTPMGTTLTGFEMADHLWHRGLWFAIKYVNHANFWEEEAPFGSQKSVEEPRVQFQRDGSLRIAHELDWSSEATGIVLHERREIAFARRDALRVIDWSTRLQATRDVELDRTPYTTWGGYGGLAFRASRELHEASFETPAGKTKSLAGERAEWLVFRALVDGGAKRTIAMGVVDHPSNDREPTPWYAKSDNGSPFWNAALLFHGPRKLGEGATLALRYRVVYRDGDFEGDEFATLAKSFRES